MTTYSTTQREFTTPIGGAAISRVARHGRPFGRLDTDDGRDGHH
jgi:hypothetical protein